MSPTSRLCIYCDQLYDPESSENDPDIYCFHDTMAERSPSYSEYRQRESARQQSEGKPEPCKEIRQ